MQTNLKFQNITFLKPVYRLRASLNRNSYIRYYLKGSTRKSNILDIDLHQFFKSEKLSWKYVKIGTQNDNLILMEGNKENGFSVSANGIISNKVLVTNLFDFFNCRIPTKPNDAIRILLEFKKIDAGIYQLKKI
jgi:hypothetical protein